MSEFEAKLKEALSSSFTEYCQAAKHPDIEDRDGSDYPRNEFPDVNSYQTYKAMEIIRPELARLQALIDTYPKTADCVTPSNGQMLWAIASDGDIVDGPMMGWDHFEGELCFIIGRGPHRDYIAKPCNTYSTSELAEAAREQK